MIERLLTDHILNKPNKYVHDYISNLKNKNIIYYEIGIGLGATVFDVARLLNNSGQIYLFSYKSDCKELEYDLSRLGYTNLIIKNCSDNRVYSGYHFDMAIGVLNNSLPNFDIAYLDGGHVFHLDAPTTCILKELCKVNGIIFFDDYNWSIARSPTLNPKIRPKTLIEYDTEQINLKHIQMICKIFMDTDERYNKILEDTRCVAYKRIK